MQDCAASLDSRLLSRPPSLKRSCAEGEPTTFDSLARLVSDELQAAYLAHTRRLSPEDEMLRILEATSILALLTRHTPKDIAEERERFEGISGLRDHL